MRSALTQNSEEIAGAVTGYAEENHADVIVFEYLKTKGKISGRKKQKLHLWRKRDIQKRCEHQAHRRGTTTDIQDLRVEYQQACL